jgi:hypothetical protein
MHVIEQVICWLDIYCMSLCKSFVLSQNYFLQEKIIIMLMIFSTYLYDLLLMICFIVMLSLNDNI